MIETLLGFDFGVKNIGVAVGNSLTETATPLKILKAVDGHPNWDEVASLIDEWDVTAFVVGIPYTQDGTITEHIRRIRNFKNRLHGRFGLPAYEVDESNSSLESYQYLSPSKRQKRGELDALSAAIIIERWFAEKRGY